MRDDDDSFDREKFRVLLGGRIARVRKQQGYSQDRLSLEAGLARGTLSKIESGQREAMASTLFRISEVLEVPVSKFFEFKM